MQTELESLIVRLIGDTTQFTKSIDQSVAKTQEMVTATERASRQIGGVTFRLNQFGQTALSMLRNLGLTLGGIGLIRSAVQLAASAEEMEISFSTMLGSMEAGANMVRQLQDFAAATPMDMSSIQMGARTLLQFGVAADDLIPTLRMIGDVTGGQTQKFNQLALAFGQVSSAGRLQGQDLMQMINVGFNPLQEIAQHTGKSVADLRKEMENGRVTIDMVIDSFQRATSAGGQFDGLMLKQSKSLSGLFSTMQDDINAALREIGRILIEELDLKGMISSVSTGAKAVADFLKSLSPQFKETAAVVLKVILATAAFSASLVALELIGTPLLNILKGTVGTFLTLGRVLLMILNPLNMVKGAFLALRAATLFAFGPWGLVIAAAAVAIGILIDRLGGFEKAMETVGKIGADAWAMIQNAALEAWVALEFGFTNFEAIAQHAWTGAQLGFVQLVSEIRHFFAQTLPYLLGFFLRNWQDVFTDAWNFSTTVLTNLAQNAVNIFSNLPGLIAGTVDWSQVWTPLTQGFESSITEALQLPQREMSQLEQQLMDEFQAQGEALGGAFETFRTQRLAQLLEGGGVDASADAARNAGRRIGESMNQGMGKELKQMDAVLAGSAEALSRISEYKERLSGADAGGQPPSIAAPNALRNLANQSNALTNSLRNQVQPSLVNFANASQTVWPSIQSIGEGIWSTIQEAGRNLWANVYALAPSFFNNLSLGFTETISFIQGLAIGFWGMIGPYATAIWDTIYGVANNIWVGIGNVVSNLWNNDILGAAQAYWNTVLGIAETVWNGIPAIAAGAWHAIQTAGIEMWRVITDLFSFLSPQTYNQTQSAATIGLGALTGGGQQIFQPAPAQPNVVENPPPQDQNTNDELPLFQQMVDLLQQIAAQEGIEIAEAGL